MKILSTPAVISTLMVKISCADSNGVPDHFHTGIQKQEKKKILILSPKYQFCL